MSSPPPQLSLPVCLHRDFFINGKLNIGNERVGHHYAGALNAVPLMRQFRR